MQIRNPIYTSFGCIDCEINHPVYGWIPYTAEIDGDVFNAAKATAKPAAKPAAKNWGPRRPGATPSNLEDAADMP